MDFIFVPGLRVTKLGEQPHTPTLYPIHPVLEIDGACILEVLVSRPRPNGPFVIFSYERRQIPRSGFSWP